MLCRGQAHVLFQRVKNRLVAKYQNDLFSIRQRAIGRLLLLARRDFLKRVDEQLEATGYGSVPQQLLALTPYIDPEGTRNTALAERAGMSKQAIGKKIVELEKLGLLVRLPDPTDGRAFLVQLTDESVEHVKAVSEAITQVEKSYAKKLGVDGFEQLKKLLEGLVH